MELDDRIFIRLDRGMPENAKIEWLSDAAFRLLIECWCWCARNETDGRIVAGSWNKRGTPKARRELMTTAPGQKHPLVEDDLMGGVIMHDYDKHQKTKDEIEVIRQDKRSAGAFGNHVRHHIEKNINSPTCTYCTLAK